MRLFIVDDEPSICRVLATLFKGEGYEVHTFHQPQEALGALAESDCDVIISDLMMPGMTGVQFLQALRERGSTIPVLMITAHGTIQSAVEAIKLGAFDYLTKPFDMETVKIAVQRAATQASLLAENAYLRQELQSRYQFGNLIGSSPRVQEVYRLIEKAAGSRANVLILGESGTGKELVARALHFNSPRSAKRFVAVSCAALPEELLESELFGHEKGSFTGANWQRAGRFELADGGTLFLDEIGDVPMQTQIKLLRVLQEKEFERVGGTKPIKVDIRLISATNRNLPEMIAKNAFREDLYYRLRVVEILLPPLRERKEDIPLLVRHFIQKYAQLDGKRVENLSEEALATMLAYAWPGNIRELENAVEHALVMADDSALLLTTDLLPLNVQRARPSGPVRLPVELLDESGRGSEGGIAERDTVAAGGSASRSEEVPVAAGSERAAERSSPTDDVASSPPAAGPGVGVPAPPRPLAPSSGARGGRAHSASPSSPVSPAAATPALLFDAEGGRETVLAALEAHAWEMGRAAESLGMTLPLLRAHVKKFGLTRKAGGSGRL